jgi:acetolactate synthase regulatory subunit
LGQVKGTKYRSEYGTTLLTQKEGAVFVLELHANDMHSVLGRLLDQIRVAGLKLTAVSAWAEGSGYKIRATLDASDRDIDKLARRLGTMIGVSALDVQRECSHLAQMPRRCRAEREDAASAS